MHGLPSACSAERRTRIAEFAAPWWSRAVRVWTRVCAVACLLLGAWSSAWAVGIEARNASLDAQEDGWYADADFEIDFNPTLADAVQRGVALYFAVEIEIKRPRWYWLDERVLHAQRSVRLSYNALTSQYRVVVGDGPLAQRFDDVSSAIAAIAHVRGWRLGDRGVLRAGRQYEVQVRMRLDTNQLPKPFQLNAITDRDWALASDWLRFEFKP